MSDNPSPRILLMYISKVSGHRQATKAIEKSVKRLNINAYVGQVNGFGETFPLMEKIINSLYMLAIKIFPQLWDWMYDNPSLVKRSKNIKANLHRKSEPDIERVIKIHRPDVIICSQAFPCGMAAHYKKKYNLDVSIIGVLTDYAPHSYWINEGVDHYVVPSNDTKEKLIAKGVDGDVVHALGIPIRYTFAQSKDRVAIAQRLGLDLNIPTVLIMGGGHGLGPIKKVVNELDQSGQTLQMIVIAGANQSLMKWLEQKKITSSNKMIVYDYTDKIDELMDVASLIVTKPGGMTTAECLAKGLPMVIVSPLPGQERCNTEFLIENGIAVYVKNVNDIADEVKKLLDNPTQLEAMRKQALQEAYPHSAEHIAKLALECA